MVDINMAEGVVGIKPANDMEREFDEQLARVAEETQSVQRSDANVVRLNEVAKTRIVYVPDRSSFTGDTLQIGDLLFGMAYELAPPQVIHIDKQIINYKWHTLRSDSVSKIASGNGADRIAISLYFVGVNQINHGLRRLVATFKAVPFVFIENNFIRANLSPRSSETMAVSLVSLSVRTEPGMPDVLAADLELSYFNYKPYASQFLFRQEYNSASQAPRNLLTTFQSNGVQALVEGVSLPSDTQAELQTPLAKREPGVKYTTPVLVPQQSEPLVKIITMNQGPLIQQLSNRIDFDYRIYKFISPAINEAPDFGKENRALVREIDGRYATPTASDVHMKLHPEVASALENAARQFGDYTLSTSGKRRKLLVNSCYRSRQEQIYMIQTHPAEAALFSWHETGLAIDLKQEGWTRAEWDKLVQCMTQNGFSNLGKNMGYQPVWRSSDPKALSVSGKHDKRNSQGLRPDHEVWHFDYPKLQKEVLKRYGSGKTVAEQVKSAVITYSGSIKYTSGDAIFSKQLTSENGAPTSLEELRKRDEKLTNQLIALVGQDLKDNWIVDQFASNSGRVVLHKSQTFTIDEKDIQLVPQGIAISKRNIIAEIPIQGQSNSTQQYLGAGDTEAVISFAAIGIEKLQKLQGMIELVQNNACVVRQIRDASVLEIKNSIFQFMGLDEVMVDGISIQTVEGQPDLYSVTLQLTQAKRQRPRTLKQEKFLSSNAWRIAAEEIYSKFFKLGLNNVQNVRWVMIQDTRIFPTPYATSEQLLRIARNPEGRIPNVRLGRVKPYEGIMARRKTLCICELLTTQIQQYVYNANEVKWTPTDVDNFTDNHLSEILDTPIAKLLYEYAEVVADILHRPISQSGLQALGMGAFIDIMSNQYVINPDVDYYLFGEMSAEEENKIIAAASKKLSRLWSQIQTKGYYLLAPFSFLGDELRGLISEQDRGLPCYPDMSILPHPMTEDPIDTPIDFWFWNETIDGAMFSQVIQKDTTLEEAKTVMANSYASLVDRMKPEEFVQAYVSPNKGTIEEVTLGVSSTGASQLAAIAFDETGMKVTAEPVDHVVAQQLMRAYKDGQDPNDLMLPSSQMQLPDKPLRFGQFIDGQTPNEKAQKDSEEPVMSGESSRLQNILEACFQNLGSSLPRLAHAFPTFKIYFMEEDELEEGRLGLRNFDDFYSYSAVKDIRFVDSHQMPASLCVISIVNINGELDTLQFTSEDPNASNRIVEQFDPRTLDTKLENPFSKLILMEGSKIQVRLGYSNDPDDLEIIFNGQVVEVGTSSISNDIIQLVCQSYGVELVGTPVDDGSFDDTQSLLSSIICSSELQHFGRWTTNSVFDPAEVRASWMEDDRLGILGSHALWNKWRRWNLEDSAFDTNPQDDNIYAPNIKSYSDYVESAADILNFTGVSAILNAVKALEDDRIYIPADVTAWDIFKEMELRHPGFVAAPRVYGNRYTMYFGPPAHGYWSRPLTKFELGGFNLINEIRNSTGQLSTVLADDGESSVFNRVQAANLAGQVWHQTQFGNAPVQNQKDLHNLLKWLLIGRAERYKPFRNYFLLSSSHNIIANNMYASSHGTFNAVDLLYAVDRVNSDIRDKQSAQGMQIDVTKTIQNNLGHFEMKADDNIRSRETRVMSAVYTSCQGDYFARRYAVGLLMRSLKDVYKGEIAILGNPRIKVHDVCMIYDTYRDMYGPVEVGQITHILSQETGFITLIKPDLIVSHDSVTTMSTLDAMWRVGATVWNSAAELLGGIGTTGAGLTMAAIGATGVGVLGAAIIGGVSLGIAFAGGYKLAGFSQARQPIFYTPVTQGGKPLIAGIDGYKRDNLLINLHGKWVRWKGEVAEGAQDWWQRNPISTSLRELNVAILE